MRASDERNRAGGAVVPASPPQPWPTLMAKRLVDLVLGSSLLVLTAPLVLVLALILAVQGRCWPFFSHHRVGARGRLLWIPKLRTLPRSTPVYADKSTDSTRPISGLADLMRRTHLDELPQLLLVPLGRLSLVGPRPMMAHELEAADDGWRAIRSSVTPGCTGLWQVGAGQGLRVRDSPEYDAAYVRNLSLRLDAWILWRTAVQALGVGGGVSLDDVPTRLLRHTADRDQLAAHRWRRQLDDVGLAIEGVASEDDGDLRGSLPEQ